MGICYEFKALDTFTSVALYVTPCYIKECCNGSLLHWWLLCCFAYDITVTSQWARWRPKLPASRLFTQPFFHSHIKESIKALRHWPLWGEFTGDRWIPCTKGQLRGIFFPFDDVIMELNSWQRHLNWITVTRMSKWNTIVHMDNWYWPHRGLYKMVAILLTTFQMYFWTLMFRILVHIAMNFVLNYWVHITSTLARIMTWHWRGVKPLLEPIKSPVHRLHMVSLRQNELFEQWHLFKMM